MKAQTYVALASIACSPFDLSEQKNPATTARILGEIPDGTPPPPEPPEPKDLVVNYWRIEAPNPQQEGTK